MIADRIEAFLADKGYDADAIREEISSANIEAVIPSKGNRRDPIPHDKAKYKWRDQIERLFNKLKNWRRVATRYDKIKESSASSPSPQSNYGYPLSTSANLIQNGELLFFLSCGANPAGSFRRRLAQKRIDNNKHNFIVSFENAWPK